MDSIRVTNTYQSAPNFTSVSNLVEVIMRVHTPTDLQMVKSQLNGAGNMDSTEGIP